MPSGIYSYSTEVTEDIMQAVNQRTYNISMAGNTTSLTGYAKKGSETSRHLEKHLI